MINCQTLFLPKYLKISINIIKLKTINSTVLMDEYRFADLTSTELILFIQRVPGWRSLDGQGGGR